MRQRSKDGNVTEDCLLLGFVVDEDLCIVHYFGQEPVLVAKLCEVQAGRGQNKPRVPNSVFRSEPEHPRGCWPRCELEGPTGAEWPQGWPERMIHGPTK